MILGLGGPELIVILLVVLVIFGPKNLPKLGSALGKTVKNVREGMEGDDDEAEEAEDANAAKTDEESE
ncbi:MAG: twin-arginine translocase TatA/TatE family subunit [Atopobiaceae bacterium]|nr:twin-arginine translocase TatA/TatE family subunit [Atopobiaceae bacterium]MBR3314236.1 twin-arginine translocase TatA/TatE family subunit [Atopobiaceae bacterium]